MLERSIRYLYYSRRNPARLFRLALVAVDVLAIGYFLWTVREPHTGVYVAIDLGLFVFFALEFAARFWITGSRLAFFAKLSTWGDIVVLASLLLPLVVDNLGFLRILRTLRLLRSYRVWEEISEWIPAAGRYEDVVASAANLVVFVFITTSVVWVLEARINPDLNTWIDALYFTVTTLTTTGYGDITLKDPMGRLLTVFIMIFGVALFLRLAQSIFRPHKVEYACRSCGLTRHDPDASHCKHCGAVIHIRTEGEW